MDIKRVHIIGTSGSGKSFLAKKLSNLLKIKVYDLDDLFWKRKYNIERDEKERIKLLKNITKKNKWIIEGVYSSWVEDSIKRSNLIIWLDPPAHILSYRLILRFFRRKEFKELEGWKGLRLMLKYAINYHKKKQAAGYYLHKGLIEKHKASFVYIKSKKELNKFLEDFTEKLDK
jgi:adenylate kinase family enzyme